MCSSYFIELACGTPLHAFCANKSNQGVDILAKNIMFQGTGSSVGKSLITAGVCRVLKEEGYRVAPFKSQNMALNSFVTEDGKEMGRAQVVQAEAAKIKPTVEMNPILLKPTSDVGSQVILNGQVFKNMTAGEYHKEKINLKSLVKEAYDKLCNSFDTIVIEGAGSPAEINLRENDLVNMGLAELVDSPVILIGDIDRGGVFASIYGTIMLMEPEERDRIKGFVINKFRGDVDILMPGIRMLEEKINIPCLGVVPYIDINIDDEDSVTTRFNKKGLGEIIIGIIKLPYISNFSDFTPLEIEEGLNVRYISNKDDIKDVDMLIIPGSKNTIMDMKYIFDSGMDKEIYRKHREKVPIIGVCGGYQMLGKEIFDPSGIESSLQRINGLGLLNATTTIYDNKITTQTSGEFINDLALSGNRIKETVTGYEIHMGKTELFDDCIPAIRLENGNVDGAIAAEGMVFGTYLHGIFENDGLRHGIINNLKDKKGITNEYKQLNYSELKEREYDKLAQAVRKHMDMGKVKDIMGL